ncbi:uncharacterized protein LOC119307075 isoform X2 [Triticum dicoccoides]|nr:uncharacterized protein LOC119307075 isoform X2 [Triticum dicoccoides]
MPPAAWATLAAACLPLPISRRCPPMSSASCPRAPIDTLRSGQPLLALQQIHPAVRRRRSGDHGGGAACATPRPRRAQAAPRPSLHRLDARSRGEDDGPVRRRCRHPIEDQGHARRLWTATPTAGSWRCSGWGSLTTTSASATTLSPL